MGITVTMNTVIMATLRKRLLAVKCTLAVAVAELEGTMLTVNSTLTLGIMVTVRRLVAKPCIMVIVKLAVTMAKRIYHGALSLAA